MTNGGPLTISISDRPMIRMSVSNDKFLTFLPDIGGKENQETDKITRLFLTR